MANIINRANGDKTLVLGQREGLIYPLPFEDWNSIKIGAFMSTCPTTGFDMNFGPEQVGDVQEININGASDRFWYGLKNNNNSLPGDNGEPFVGFSSSSGDTLAAFELNTANSTTVGLNQTDKAIKLQALLPNGYNPGSSLLPSLYLQAVGGVSGVTNYCNFCGMRATFVDKGTATQKLTLSMASNPNGVYLSDTSDQALRDKLSSNFNDHAVTVDYQVGGIPLPPPTAIILYCPATLFQIRVHNIGTLKSA